MEKNKKKKEKEENTGPSILCVTHQMSHKNFKGDNIARRGRYCLVLSGTRSVWGATGWY